MAQEIEQDVDLNNDEGTDAQQDEGTDKGADKGDSKEKPKETLAQRKSRLERQLKQTRKQLGEEDDEPETPAKNDKKESTDLDYGQKAFLRASGIKGADEVQLVKDFMKRTGLELDAVIEDDIFTARLEKLRTTKSNELAAGAKNGRGNGESGRNSVEYWLAKTGPNDPMPSDMPKELREKFVDARRERGKHAKTFYND